MHVPSVGMCLSAHSAQGGEGGVWPKWHTGLHQLCLVAQGGILQCALHPEQQRLQNCPLVWGG